MPEQLEKTVDTPLKHLVNPAYEKWRLLKDRLARYGVVLGGLGVIVAIVLIFFYLLYVVLPLFGSASAREIAQYATPQQQSGKSLLLDAEEQNEVAARFIDNGQIVFFEVASGKVVSTETVKIPPESRITSIAKGSTVSQGVVAYGLSDGKMFIAKTQYKINYDNNGRHILPTTVYPVSEQPIIVDEAMTALEAIAVNLSGDTVTIAAKTAQAVQLVNINQEKSLFSDEVKTNRTVATIDLPADKVEKLLLDKQGGHLYVLDKTGMVYAYNINDKASPKLKFQQKIISADAKVSSLVFLNGDISLLAGDSTGQITQWTQVKDALNNPVLKNIRNFKLADKPIVAIDPEQRRKGFIAMDDDGAVGIFNTTAERELITLKIGESRPVNAIVSPRANRLLVESADGKMHHWNVDNEHPEVSIKSLWRQVWYESYSKPAYIWQSSSASNDFEPKYSLLPLVFGTLKAAFYAMLFALPLAILGAIYTAYFMDPKMRQIVKPTIELMGALPTVIIGFLAGLWLAPFIEKHLAGLFLTLIALPVSVLICSYCWQLVPQHLRQKAGEGWEGSLLIPAIIIVTWLSFTLSVPLEAWLFNGSLRDWFNNRLGIGYDQRNALVVGIAMGFAVIPTIFSIAEDAIFSVPKHLTTGSLALGATPWQTMTRVVLLTASPGIFSAVMIGLGRAIGETMIVLMATGNTPVMDFSVFQGLRTLAANVAVEMPESEIDSTHYRVLFLAALVLFLATFIFNTLAEVIRQRLREKYSSL